MSNINKQTDKILDIDKLNEIFNIQDSKPPIQPIKIDPENTKQIYEEMAKLIQTGNYILETLKFYVGTNLNNAELVTGVANIMNSIRDTLKEFTKIYINKIRHEQLIEIEKLKLIGKKELLDTKIQADKKVLLEEIQNNKHILPGNYNNQSIPLIEFSPEKIIKEIINIESDSNK